ncbi:hypothetical protein GCM10011571_01020 [Marinithermofilum abyssi]|uniref:Uncharacterized protein n=1 Tax=Marinithermofilum abyssi TaxID=1571185 RepID=A0A8J2VC91_9BACL|nr:hypothetical protein GCM10011571_01020 [Marinithermofilum abyssi]
MGESLNGTWRYSLDEAYTLGAGHGTLSLTVFGICIKMGKGG